MTFDQAELRYRTDARFAAIVDLLYHEIQMLNLSPGEARDAAMLAAVRFETKNARPFVLGKNWELSDLYPKPPAPEFS